MTLLLRLRNWKSPRPTAQSIVPAWLGGDTEEVGIGKWGERLLNLRDRRVYYTWLSCINVAAVSPVTELRLRSTFTIYKKPHSALTNILSRLSREKPILLQYR